MSKVIHKHMIQETVSLELPEGAEVVHFDRQNGVPTFWTLQDEHPKGMLRKRNFQLFGTGQSIPDDARYIGTAQFPGAGYRGAGLVWHLFEVTLLF